MCSETKTMECRGISLTHMDMTNLFLYLLLRRSVFSSNLLKRSELKIYLAFIVFLTPKTDVKHNLTLNAGLPLASRCIYTYIKVSIFSLDIIISILQNTKAYLLSLEMANSLILLSD